jgi:hypothetical protein
MTKNNMVFTRLEKKIKIYNAIKALEETCIKLRKKWQAEDEERYNAIKNHKDTKLDVEFLDDLINKINKDLGVK